jgi:hypothetical protein
VLLWFKEFCHDTVLMHFFYCKSFCANKRHTVFRFVDWEATIERLEISKWGAYQELLIWRQKQSILLEYCFVPIGASSFFQSLRIYFWQRTLCDKIKDLSEVVIKNYWFVIRSNRLFSLSIALCRKDFLVSFSL